MTPAQAILLDYLAWLKEHYPAEYAARLAAARQKKYQAHWVTLPK